MSEHTIQDLKQAVIDDDNEKAHSIYDDLIHKIAEKAEKAKVEELDRITKNMSFWYA